MVPIQEKRIRPRVPRLVAKTASRRADRMRYRLRRSEKPAPESAPPLSSIISQPADVFGMERFGRAVARSYCAVVAGAIVD